ncbi:MAG TPA: DUF2000 domain-containing protein [Candidatus Saccharimonadales bacterium]
MNQEQKCVVIINEQDAPGVAANTIACLSFGLGAVFADAVVAPTPDKNGVPHGGIIDRPVPILRADGDTMRSIFLKAQDSGVHVFDMNNRAQEAHTLDEYKRLLAETETEALNYAGIALYGPKKEVNKLTGNLKLFR